MIFAAKNLQMHKILLFITFYFCVGHLLLSQTRILIEEENEDIEVLGDKVYIEGKEVKEGVFNDKEIRVFKFENGDELELKGLLGREEIEIEAGERVFVVEIEKVKSGSNDVGFLGVGTRVYSAGELVIEQVVEGSPADIAGFRYSDVICSVDGIKVTTTDHFQKVVGEYLPGDLIVIELGTKKGPEFIQVELASRSLFLNKVADNNNYRGFDPSRIAPQRWSNGRFDKSLVETAKLGVRVELVNDAVRVAAIKPGGSADLAGVEVGDEILQVDNLEIFSVNKLFRVIKAYEINDEVELRIRRNQKIIYKQAKLQSPRTPARVNANNNPGNTSIERIVIIDQLAKSENEKKENTPATVGFKLKSFELLPDETEGLLKVAFELEDEVQDESITVRITSLEGAILREMKIENYDGRYMQSYDIAELGKGVYLFQLELNGQNFTRQFVIEDDK